MKKLQKLCHKIAVEKGFWEKDRNNGELLMLIVSELGEALEALRKGNRQAQVYSKKTKENISKWVKDTFEDELADAVIRIFDLAEARNIDLEWQIRNKLKYNKTRPYKHNKEF